MTCADMLAKDTDPTRLWFHRRVQCGAEIGYSSGMRVILNGKEQQYPEPLSLSQLIEQLGMKGDRIAVELNRDIVGRSQWAETPLRDGDRLDIVHFVGGGGME